MCTLSLFRTEDGFKVFMNRDESHSREIEKPPRFLDFEKSVYGPVDPQSGGTWIAKNESGHWGCLLNGYFDSPQDISRETISRGTILAKVLSSQDPIQAARQLDPKYYQSFRLLVGSATSFVLLEWNKETYAEIDFHAQYKQQAYFLSSSSWKQSEVIRVRKSIFNQWVEQHDFSLTNLKRVPSFHLSTLPSPEYAPMMLRSYAGTKSITELEISPVKIDMTYHKVSACKIQSEQTVLECVGT